MAHDKGYTGRKLIEYTWIPKSKTDLREYREFLKICLIVQNKLGSFNDITVGQEMVGRRAIVDRDNTSDSYLSKYSKKTVGNVSYISNARMMIRICRWLGWITKSKDKAKFFLTPYGINLTKFSGVFPSRIGQINEGDLVERAFSKMKYFSPNDSINFRNTTFRKRIFVNMLKVLSDFNYCSHYELVVSAFVLKDERDPAEYKKLIQRVSKLKHGELTIADALEEEGLDSSNKSTVTGVYDGPKVLLSFARQLGFVENIDVNKNKSISFEYKTMYENSGHIKPNGIKAVSKITAKGMDFLKKYGNKKMVWFDELSYPIEESALIIFLNKIKTTFILSKLNNSKMISAAKDLSNKGIIGIKGDSISLLFDTDYDLYQDIPYESRDQVITVLNQIYPGFLEVYKLPINNNSNKELFISSHENTNGKCIYCSNPRCKDYAEYSDQYGSSDRFSERVCPVDIIKTRIDGSITIDADKCISCMLCVVRCPFDAVTIKEKKLVHSISNHYTNIELKEKKRLTELFIAKKSTPYIIPIEDIADVINQFQKLTCQPGKEIKKDPYYVAVRNFFRELGFKASYSGSGGMKTRSDVTLYEPYLITSEVKSPAEGSVNLKAVRQTLDAAVQNETDITLAIGSSIHKGAIEQEQKYRRDFPKKKICLLEIKHLMFLFLIRDIIYLTPNAIKELFENNPGHLNKDRLINFIKNHSESHQIHEDIVDRIISQLQMF